MRQSPLAKMSRWLAGTSDHGWSAKAAIGEFTQHRDDGFGVMAVRGGDIDRQRDAVFLNRHLDLDAADLLAAVNAACKATWRRATGTAVDDHGARFCGIAA